MDNKSEIKTGIDIIEVSRIRQNIEKYGEKFLNRIYTKKEVEYCESKKAQKYQSYAGRFAAKEAVFKAISELLENKYEIEWKDIEIINDKNGKPNVQIHGKTSKLINGKCTIDISISHVAETAVASVVCNWGRVPVVQNAQPGTGNLLNLFDNHAHYNDEKFDEDREEVLSKIYESGVTKLISAGYSLESSIQGLELAKNHDFIYTTAGISPNDIPGEIQDENLSDKSDKEIEELFTNSLEIVDKQLIDIEKIACENKKIVAIGEIGLDYYWNKNNKELQKAVFIKQIKLANKLNLPIVIHTREAVMDTLTILKNECPTIKPGVFHCCPLNVELVKEALKQGFYISFCGPVTFKNSKNARDVVGLVPFDRMLIETDSPYLAPEPVRGTRNDSRNVRYVAEKLAEFKNVDVETIAKCTYENAKRVYRNRVGN